jgi:hypothetical protein
MRGKNIFRYSFRVFFSKTLVLPLGTFDVYLIIYNKIASIANI